MFPLRYDGKVAIVTGAGGGLGRAHALALAARGARVVVNDLGTSANGAEENISLAEQVVQEVIEAGGQAIANRDSVSDGHQIVTQALDVFGRVDIIVNNAGFLRDVSFHKMTIDDWQDLYNVHLFGAFRVTHAAWPHFRDQRYGRVVNTSSAAGIYGNFGQANYSAFKLACHGMTQSLAIEGAGRNIHVNTIAPAANSRLSRTVMSAEMLRPMRPELVSPMVCYLCHEDTKENGGLFEIGGGWVGKLRWQRTRGVRLGQNGEHSPEDVAEHWSEIIDFEDASSPSSMQEASAPFQAIMDEQTE